MDVDDPAMQGARALAAMIFTLLSHNIPISAPEELNSLASGEFQ